MTPISSDLRRHRGTFRHRGAHCATARSCSATGPANGRWAAGTSSIRWAPCSAASCFPCAGPSRWDSCDRHFPWDRPRGCWACLCLCPCPWLAGRRGPRPTPWPSGPRSGSWRRCCFSAGLRPGCRVCLAAGCPAVGFSLPAGDNWAADDRAAGGTADSRAAGIRPGPTSRGDGSGHNLRCRR